MPLAYLSRQSNSVHLRHVHVEDREVECSPARARERSTASR
jgi:hypothetical protein